MSAHDMLTSGFIHIWTKKQEGSHEKNGAGWGVLFTRPITRPARKSSDKLILYYEADDN
jgi:hypothetical protein